MELNKCPNCEEKMISLFTYAMGAAAFTQYFCERCKEGHKVSMWDVLKKMDEARNSK